MDKGVRDLKKIRPAGSAKKQTFILQLLSKGWQLETSGFEADNRFKKTFQFYPPISARFGVRLSF
jgi:hypothetical protein